MSDKNNVLIEIIDWTSRKSNDKEIHLRIIDLLHTHIDDDLTMESDMFNYLISEFYYEDEVFIRGAPKSINGELQLTEIGWSLYHAYGIFGKCRLSKVLKINPNLGDKIIHWNCDNLSQKVYINTFVFSEFNESVDFDID